tara:strand:+ start:413 stop:1081 length:669 start_codon:yes stop_codon:yes gene_type:complete
MPEETIYMNDTGIFEDGYIWSTSATWAGARDATTAGLMSDTGNNSNLAVLDRKLSVGRGGSATYSVIRSFFQFDVSDITLRPESARIGIHGIGSENGTNVLGVKANALPYLSNTDFDAIVGWTTGDNVNNVIIYTDTITDGNWDTSDYNYFQLTNAALSDLQGGTTFDIAFLTQQDLRDLEPGNNVTNAVGMVYSETTGTTSDPKIVYTTGSRDSFFLGANF